MAAQGEDGPLDQAIAEQGIGHRLTGVECGVDGAVRQRPDIKGDAPVAEVAGRVNVAGGPAVDGGVAGQVDGVGYDRGGGVGLRGGARQDGDGVGNPERKAAAAGGRR